MAKKIQILSVFGTRPEAIKMVPVLREFKKHPEKISSRVCVTGQHRGLLDDVLTSFNIQPDYDLQIMERDQSPEEVVSLSLARLRPILRSEFPDWVLVQGDTATTLAASLAAFYLKVKVGHIEAGLRTHDRWTPFPEEAHRRMISCLASCHFAPTNDARNHLIAEGIPAEDILVTGNTGIDTLLQTLKKSPLSMVDSGQSHPSLENIISSQGSKKIILVTVHRHENHGKPLEDICRALKKVAEEDVRILFIVHPNPSIRKPVHQLLAGVPNLDLLPPLDYCSFTMLLGQADLILTDSGGIQEEAPALGKPLMILRSKTERYTSTRIESNQLVGTNPDVIIREVKKWLADEARQAQAVEPSFLYGDGQAGKRIAGYFLGNSPEPFSAEQPGESDLDGFLS